MKAFAIGLALAAALACSGAQAQQTAAPAMPVFTDQMRSVKIESQDFAKTVAFYTALGMKVGINRGATADLVWEGKTGNSGLVIVNSEYAARAKMVRGGAYLMFITSDIKAALARLIKAGFTMPEPRAMGTMVSVAMISDPDGNRIELMGPLLK